MTPRKGMRIGFLLSGMIVLIILVSALVIGILAYDGTCIYFEPPPRECTLGEYLPTYFFLLLLTWLFGKPLLTALVFLLLMGLPSAGYVLGLRHRKPTIEP